MNFSADTIQTYTAQLMDMGFSAINSLDKGSVISTSAIKIIMPRDGNHWSAPNHMFGETTAVGVSEAKSDYD